LISQEILNSDQRVAGSAPASTALIQPWGRQHAGAVRRTDALHAEHRGDATARCPTEPARRLVDILSGAEPLGAGTDDLRQYIALWSSTAHTRPPPSTAPVTAEVLRLGHRRPARAGPGPAQAPQSRRETGLALDAGHGAHPHHARTGRLHRAEAIGLSIAPSTWTPTAVVIGKAKAHARSPTVPDRAGVNPLPPGPGRSTPGNTTDALRLGQKGALTDGLGQMLECRCEQAGIARVHAYH
jgi:hypothetical protein